MTQWTDPDDPGDEAQAQAQARADANRRAAYRRRRSLTIVLAVVAVSGLLVGLIVAVRGNGSTPVSANGPDPYPTVPSSKMADVTATYPTGTDLQASGPATLALQPGDGRYRGVLTITVRNVASMPFNHSLVYLGLPPGVTIDFTADPPLDFGGCGGAAPPENGTCIGSSIPALGGQRTYEVHVMADYAPQPVDMTIPGFTIRFAAARSDGTLEADLSPANNRVATTLVLTGGN